MINNIFLAVGTHPLPTDVLKGCTEGFMYCFFEWANQVTFGAFWILTLATFCFALFMATARFGSQRAFGFSGFVGLIGGVWLATLQFIPWWAASVFILTGAVSVAMLVLSER